MNKHTIRDLFITIVSVLGIAFLYRACVRRKGPLVRVLCFHDIADRVWFEKVIAMLRNDFNVITPEQFHRNEYDSTKINILLTFDDGYQTWIDNCLPVLEKYGVKGLFFISSGLLDVSENRQYVDEYMHQQLLITPKKALSWKGAQMLIRDGHTVGGHTVTHPNLAKLELSEVQSEVSIDKEIIEEKLGVVLSDFAYPFGTEKNFSSDTIRAVRLSGGYQFQYSALAGFIQKTTSEQIIHRMLIEKNFSISKLNQWVLGGYDIFSLFKSGSFQDNYKLFRR